MKDSKEALKRLYYDAISSIIDEEIETINREEIEKDYMNVKQSLDRLEKLEKVIEKIKNLPNCDICDANWHKGCMCLQRKIKEVLSNER